jgi:transposase
VILTPSRAVRVFAFPAPADLRNGYNGLFGLVQNKLNADPMNGDLFLFVNESRKMCKVLVWDGTGLCIFQKRLERGCFAKLWRDDGQVVTLTQSELALFIEGCTLIDRRSLSPVALQRKVVVSAPAM